MLTACMSYAQDTVAINYHENGRLAALVTNFGDSVDIIALNKYGVKIFERTCNLDDDIVDYTFTYFDSGAVESIKLAVKNHDNNISDVQYAEFNESGLQVTTRHVTGVDVVIEEEGKSYNFEGGVVFKPRFEKE